jgi:hypothetical protein
MVEASPAASANDPRATGGSPEGRIARLIGPLLAGVLVVAVAYLLEAVPHADLLVLCAALVTASAWVLQREVGVLDLRRLTIPGVWYLTYLVMILVPSLFVFSSHPGPTRGRFIAGVLSLLVTVPAGILLANRLTRFKRPEIDRYLQAPIDEPAGARASTRNCAIWLGVIVALACAYISEVKELPLLHMLRHPGDTVALVLLREDSLKLLASPLVPVYYLMRMLGFPLLIIVTLGYWLVWRGRGRFLLFLASLMAGLLYASLSIAKAPVAEIVLVGCLFLFLRSGWNVPRRRLFLGAVSGIALMLLFPMAVVLTVYQGSGVNPGSVILGIGRRLFYLPAEIVYWYFTLFPRPEGFLHGRTIGDVAWLMGWEYFNAPNFVGRYGLEYWVESVNANGAFISNLFADFGAAGVILGGLVAGALMQTLQIWLLRRPKSVFNLATYAYLVFAFWLLNSTALPIVLSANGVLLLVLAPGAGRQLRMSLTRLRDARRAR